MAAIIKNKFRLQNARDFMENFIAGRHSVLRNHYLFIGKPTVWGTGSQSEELSPPLPTDTVYEEERVWEEMLGLKKIEEVYSSLVIPRSDWDTSGNTIYAIFDDRDSELYRQPTQARSEAASPQYAGNFYVMTEDAGQYDIFICLENGNGGVSTQKPVRKNPATDLVDYGDLDGYVWKYITTITSSDTVRFLTDSWIPVGNLSSDDGSFQWDVQQAAVGGELLSVKIENSGTGYGFSDGTLQLLDVKLTAGTIQNSVIGGNTKGQAILTGLSTPSSVPNFYAGAQIHVLSGSNAGAIYTIESYDSASKQITLTTAWETSGATIIVDAASSLRILPRLNVTTNGVSVKLRPVLNSLTGAITRIIVLDGGEDCSSMSISVVNSIGGSGAILRPILSSNKGLGADIEKDLGAFYVMLNAKLKYEEGDGDFPLNNDYRQLGIIRDVRNFDGTLATLPTRIATKKLNITSITGNPLGFDEIIQNASQTAKAKVLDYIPSTTVPGDAVITYIQTPDTGYGTFSNGETIQGTVSSFAASIKSSGGVINEEIRKYEGEILYLENRRSVLRSQDQIEDIKAIIEF